MASRPFRNDTPVNPFALVSRLRGGPGAPRTASARPDVGCRAALALVSMIVMAAARLAAGAEPAAPAGGPADGAGPVAAFRALCAARSEAAEKANTMTVEGKDGWLFLDAELRHMSVGRFWGEDAARVTRASKPEWSDPIPAILDFKEQLAKLNIPVILVPVPPKSVIYPEMVGDAAAGSSPRLDVCHQEFYKLLRDRGVEVLDLTDEFIQARKQDAGDRRVYCMTDTHWSPAACELAARRLAALAEKPLGLPQLHNPFKVETRAIEIVGDLEKARSGEAAKRETLAARVVSPSGEDAKVTDTVDRTSPVLLLGDSHCLVFHAGGDMLATGAGLADQLAFDLCIPVDLLGVRGSGATPARMTLMQRARGDDKYLAGKKIVIWCFAAREFTESQGWRKVPVVK